MWKTWLRVLRWRIELRKDSYIFSVLFNHACGTIYLTATPITARPPSAKRRSIPESHQRGGATMFIRTCRQRTHDGADGLGYRFEAQANYSL